MSNIPETGRTQRVQIRLIVIQVLVFSLLLTLGGVFLAGFSEAVGVAVPLVVVFLALNLVVVVVGAAHMVGADGHSGSHRDFVESTWDRSRDPTVRARRHRGHQSTKCPAIARRGRRDCGQ